MNTFLMQCPKIAVPHFLSLASRESGLFDIALVQHSATTLERFASGGNTPPLPKDFV
jgi:hypothetical protein